MLKLIYFGYDANTRNWVYFENLFLGEEVETAVNIGQRLLQEPNLYRGVKLLDYRRRAQMTQLNILAHYDPDWANYWTARKVGIIRQCLPKLAFIDLKKAPGKPNKPPVAMKEHFTPELPPAAPEKAVKAPRKTKRERKFTSV